MFFILYIIHIGFDRNFLGVQTIQIIANKNNVILGV